MMKYLWFLILLTACPTGGMEGGGTNPTRSSEAPLASQGTTALQYQTTFSPYVLIRSDQKKLKFLYTFFRNQDIRIEQKQIVIACTYQTLPPDGVSQLTAPVDQPCSPYVLDFSEAEFTLEGMEVDLPEDRVYEKFVEDFEMELTPDGMIDVVDGSVLQAEGGTLEDYLQKILARRL